MTHISSVDDADEINSMIPVIASIWKNTSIREELADTLRAIVFNGGLVLKYSENAEIDALLIGVAGFRVGITYLYSRLFTSLVGEERYSGLLKLFNYAKEWAVENFYNLVVSEFDPFNIYEASLFFQTLKSTSSSIFDTKNAHRINGEYDRFETLKLIAEFMADKPSMKNETETAQLIPVPLFSLIKESDRFLKESMIGLQLPGNIEAERRDDPDNAILLETAAYNAFRLLFGAGFKITSVLLDKDALIYVLMK